MSTHVFLSSVILLCFCRLGTRTGFQSGGEASTCPGVFKDCVSGRWDGLTAQEFYDIVELCFDPEIPCFSGFSGEGAICIPPSTVVPKDFVNEAYDYKHGSATTIDQWELLAPKNNNKTQLNSPHTYVTGVKEEVPV